MRGLYDRFRVLIHELAKFGIVGALTLVVDLTLFDQLVHSAGLGQGTSKIISTVVASTLAYLGNRLWSFRHRENTTMQREYVQFLVINGIALVFALVVLQITGAGLGIHGRIAVNAINLFTIAVGTVFRFWAYRRFVFLAVPAEAEEALALHAAGELGDPAAAVAAASVVHEHHHDAAPEASPVRHG